MSRKPKAKMRYRLNQIILSLILLTLWTQGLRATALQESQTKLQSVDENGNTALMLAVRSKNYKRVKQLLSAGADPNLKRTGRDQYFGWNALMFALHNKDLPSLKLLLKHKASPDGIMKIHYGSGWTPLMYAIETQQSEAALALLNAGAKIEARNEYSMQSIQEGGVTALTLAIRHQNLRVARVLIAQGADFSTVYDAPNGQETALSEALQHHQMEKLIPLMLNQKVNKPTGPSACLIAAQYNLFPALKNLPQGLNFEDCERPLKDGSTAFLWAAYRGNLEMLRALKKLKINIKKQDNQGHNALWYLQYGQQDQQSPYAPLRTQAISSRDYKLIYQNLLQWGISDAN